MAKWNAAQRKTYVAMVHIARGLAWFWVNAIACRVNGGVRRRPFDHSLDQPKTDQAQLLAAEEDAGDVPTFLATVLAAWAVAVAPCSMPLPAAFTPRSTPLAAACAPRSTPCAPAVTPFSTPLAAAFAPRSIAFSTFTTTDGGEPVAG